MRSLELTDVHDGEYAPGVTLPLGGLSLMDLSERSPKAAKIVVRSSRRSRRFRGWRGAPLRRRRHLARSGTAAYAAAAVSDERHAQFRDTLHRDALEFASLVERIELDALLSIKSVSSARRPLLAYGAAVLEEDGPVQSEGDRRLRPWRSRGSSTPSSLPRSNPKIPDSTSRAEFNQLRSRAPDHAEDLYAWTSRLIKSTHLEEDDQDRRLRHAACYCRIFLGAPRYRGAQAYDLVANAAFIGIDRP